MAKINITISGTTYDGELDLAGDRNFFDKLENLLKSKKGTKELNTTKVQKSLDDLSDSAKSAAQSLNGLTGNFSNVGDRADEASEGLESVLDVSKLLGKGLSGLSSILGSTSGSLAQMSGMMGKGSKGLGGLMGGLGKAGGSLAQMSGMLGSASKGLGALAGAAGGPIGLLISALPLLAEAISNMIDAASIFTKYLFVGGNKFSDFTETLHQAMSKIPIVGPVLSIFTGVLNETIKVLDQYVDLLDKTSASGAEFNHSIMEMRGAAYKTGLTLEQFANIVSSNSEKLALFGTVTEGAMKFARVSNIVRGDLRKLGFSTQEINESLPSVMGIFSSAAQERYQSETELAQSAKTLMTELDAIAKLTGKNRQKMVEEQAAAAQDAAWKLKMSGMNKRQQEEMEMLLANIRNTMGPQAEKAMKGVILGMPPLTKEQRVYTAMFRDSNRELYEWGRNIAEGREDLSDSQALARKRDKLIVDAQSKQIAVANRYRTHLSHIAQGGENTLGTIYETFNKLLEGPLTREGQLDKEEAMRRRNRAREAQKNQETVTAELRNFENFMAEFRKTIFDEFVLPLFKENAPLIKDLISATKGLLSVTRHLVTAFGQLLRVVMFVVKGALGPVSWLGKLGESISDLKTGAGTKSENSEPTSSTFDTVSNITEKVAKVAFSYASGTWVKDLALWGIDKVSSEGRATGTLGSTGKLFEDFGKGTQITAHNLESVMTPAQLKDIVTASQQRLVADLGQSLFQQQKFDDSEKFQSNISKLLGVTDTTDHRQVQTDFLNGIDQIFKKHLGGISQKPEFDETKKFQVKMIKFMEEGGLSQPFDIKPIEKPQGPNVADIILGLTTKIMSSLLPGFSIFQTLSNTLNLLSEKNNGESESGSLMSLLNKKPQGTLMGAFLKGSGGTLMGEFVRSGSRKLISDFFDSKYKPLKKQEIETIVTSIMEPFLKPPEQNIQEDEITDMRASIIPLSSSGPATSKYTSAPVAGRRSSYSGRNYRSAPGSTEPYSTTPSTTPSTSPDTAPVSGARRSNSQDSRNADTTGAETISITYSELAKQGLILRPGGDVHSGKNILSKKLISLSKQIPSSIDNLGSDLKDSKFPKFQYITGLNDSYPRGKNSKHRLGRAVDFTLSSWPSRDQGRKIVESLKKLGFNYAQDEYNFPSGGASGPHIHAEISRATGTLGSTGKLFEDFGKGTQITAHNLESVMTPAQLKDIVTSSQDRISNEIANKITTANNEIQTRMLNQLSQIREILDRSQRYHREIASNI